MPPKKLKQWPPVAVLSVLEQEGQTVIISTAGTLPGRTGHGKPADRAISEIAAWSLYWGDGQSDAGIGTPAFQYTHDYPTALDGAVVILEVVDVNTLRARATLTLALPGVPPPPTPPAPSAPVGLTAVAVSDTVIALAWTDTADTELGYTVERRIGANPFAAIASLPPGAESYQDTGLVESTTYDYRVRAFNDGGASAYSNVAQETTDAGAPPPPPPPPNEPGDLVALPSSPTTIALTWTDNSLDEDSFILERRIAPAAFAEVARPGVDVTSYLDAGLTPATAYEYRIKATNTGGDSGYAATVGAATPAAPPPDPPPPPPLPAAPTGLAAAAQGTSAIALTWIDNAIDETGYTLERRVGSDPAWAPLATLPPGTTSYLDQTLTAATTYTYRVRAFNATGVSAFSNTASATTAAAPPPPVSPPAAPTGLTATPVSSTAIQLQWVDQATTETSYSVEERPPGGTFGVIATLPAGSTIYQQTGLVAGSTHEYRVRCANAGGVSAYSNVASAMTPLPPPPPPPGSVAVTAVAGAVATGNLLTITGANLHNQQTAGWDPFYTANATRWQFGGASLAADGYGTPVSGNFAYTSAVKLFGSQSAYANIALAPGTYVCPGANRTAYTSAPLSRSSGTFYRSSGTFYTRAYGRWRRNGTHWPIYQKWTEALGQTGFGGYYLQPSAGGGNVSQGLIAYVPATTAPTRQIALPQGPPLLDDRWYCVESEATLSSTIANQRLRVWIDGVLSLDVTGTWSSLMRVQLWLFGIINGCHGAGGIDQDCWTDGMVTGAQRIQPACVVEISDNATYGAGVLRYQAPEFISDGQLRVTCDLTGLGAGPYFLYVRNNALEQSTAFAL